MEVEKKVHGEDACKQPVTSMGNGEHPKAQEDDEEWMSIPYVHINCAIVSAAEGEKASLTLQYYDWLESNHSWAASEGDSFAYNHSAPNHFR